MKIIFSYEFNIQASYRQGDSIIQNYSLRDTQNCCKEYQNPFVTFECIANRYQDLFRENQNWKVNSIIERVRRDLKVDMKVIQAKKKAWELIKGADEEQYAKLKGHCLVDLTKSLQINHS